MRAKTKRDIVCLNNTLPMNVEYDISISRFNNNGSIEYDVFVNNTGALDFVHYDTLDSINDDWKFKNNSTVHMTPRDLFRAQ